MLLCFKGLKVFCTEKHLCFSILKIISLSEGIIMKKRLILYLLLSLPYMC